MNVESDAALEERPVVSTVVVALVATVAYTGVQLVMDGRVDPVETAVFVLIFTLVYVGGKRVLNDRDGDGDTGGDGAD